jgi:hypothetical protein
VATIEVQVTVSPDGEVSARRDDGAYGPSGPCRFSGVDAELIRVFEGWLEQRDRQWQWAEIKAFGSLLHRTLFPPDLWNWVESSMSALGPRDRMRVQLQFPSERMAQLAAVPWEYLHVPDRPGRDGYFLAAERRCVLSRFIPLESGRQRMASGPPVRVLVLVAQPADPLLGEVVAQPVLDTLQELSDTLPLELTVQHQPSRHSLRDAVATVHPHVVHYMGHGRFDAAAATGSIALVDAAGRADWVGEAVLAQLFDDADEPPRLVVFHSCETAQTDYSASFAGLAPRMIRSGVQCVVAMQYAVTNRTAIDFSNGFYEGLARGLPVDEAVQRGRSDLLVMGGDDARLLGIPVLYLHSRDAVLVAPSTDTDG